MKFPFSIFGKKAESSTKAPPEQEKEKEPAAFPVELAVAQVQAETGLRFGSPPAQISELQEAAAALNVPDQIPVRVAAPTAPQPETEPMLKPVFVPVPNPAPPPAVVPGSDTSLTALEPQVELARSEVSPDQQILPASILPPDMPASGELNGPKASPTERGVVREEVIAAYRLFLRRDPESEAVIASRLGLSRERLLATFMVAPRFLQRAENVRLLIEVAKSLEMRLEVAEPASGIPVLTSADVEAAKQLFWPEPHDQAIQPPVGETADRTLAHLMRSEHFQKNAFNANLVDAIARQVVERLKKGSEGG
jgi:hypothetical protein